MGLRGLCFGWSPNTNLNRGVVPRYQLGPNSCWATSCGRHVEKDFAGISLAFNGSRRQVQPSPKATARQALLPYS